MPRRSNGCETCKRRKVKCDEAKPTCLRCPRQGYECEGYGNPLALRRKSPAFRDQTQRVAARAQASYARGTFLTAPIPRGSPIPRASPAPNEYSNIDENEHPTVLLSSTPVMEFLPTLQQMQTSRERRTQMLANFIHLYLPHYTSNLDRSHFAYMYLLPDIIGQHPAIPSAVDALCMYHLGREYDDPHIVAKSKSIYGNAISRLASNLDKTNRYAPTGTLAAIILLAQCELNQGHSTNSFAWENHLQGALLLLESFEPLAWDTNEGRLLLQALRYVLACQGLTKRRAIIFTRPEWESLVAGEGASDSWVSLMNITSQIPGHLEESDHISRVSPGHKQLNRGEQALARAMSLRSQLLSWYNMMIHETAPAQHVPLSFPSRDWYEPSPYDAEIAYVFHFQDYRSAYLVMQYKFFALALAVNILELYDARLVNTTLEQSHFVRNSLSEREAMEQEAHALAMDVGRCIPTVLDPATPSVSRFNGAVCIKSAGEYFWGAGELDKAYWCREMERRLQRHSFHVPETVKLRLPGGED